MHQEDAVRGRVVTGDGRSKGSQLSYGVTAPASPLPFRVTYFPVDQHPRSHRDALADQEGLDVEVVHAGELGGVGYEGRLVHQVEVEVRGATVA